MHGAWERAWSVYNMRQVWALYLIIWIIWDIWEVLTGEVATSSLLRRDGSLYGAMYDCDVATPPASIGWCLGPWYHPRLAGRGSSTMVGGRCSRCRYRGISGERGVMTIATTSLVYIDDGCIGGKSTLVAWLPLCQAVAGCRQWCDKSVNKQQNGLWPGLHVEGEELHEGGCYRSYTSWDRQDCECNACMS